MAKKKQSPQKKVDELGNAELTKLGKQVALLYETGYISTSRLLWFSFVKGIAYGFGLFLGGTIVVALLAWIMSWFEEVPLLQPVVDVILDAINNSGLQN